MQIYNVLIFGASYGSLLGAKLALAGQNVTLVCLPDEVEAINRDGVIVRLPVKDRDELVEIDTRSALGTLRAADPRDVNPAHYDLVVLAMQEPQYGSPGVRELLEVTAKAGVACMAIMNMPPLPYFHRVPGVDASALHHCYADASVWQYFDPANVTICSPDPQAFRPPDEPVNVLHVTLPTNFKASRFASHARTKMLRDIEAAVDDTRLPVKLKIHDSVYVPMAKWAMLITGNYRCVTKDGPRSIRDAVYSDREASRAVYEWVCDLCVKLGASRDDLVPFEKYAAAADILVKPSSAARALYAGAKNIERVDRLVQALAVQQGMQSDVVDEIVTLVDARLERNRAEAVVS